VYELTEHGRGLVPVLDALAGWGSRLPVRSGRGLSRDALLFALRSTVRVETAPPVRIVLDGTGFDAVVEDRALDLRHRPDRRPRRSAPARPGCAAWPSAISTSTPSSPPAGPPSTAPGAAVRGFLAAFARPAPNVERVG
jgi:hypothetical protein